jgi:hypothetical protein
MPTPGFTTVTGNLVRDSTGDPVSNATMTFTPVDSSGRPVAYRAGAGDGTYGATTATPVYVDVVAGAFSIVLADVLQTDPVNIGYAVSLRNNVSDAELFAPGGYSFIQPYGDTWSFDSFIPDFARQVTARQGPAGTVRIGTVVSTEGGDASVSNGGTLQNAVLNFSIPRAPSGISYSKATYTSVMGCLGGTGNATHDSALLNALLGAATPTVPVFLMLDQPLVTSGLFLAAAGNTTIQGFGWGTSISQASGSNEDVIHNGPPGCGKPFDPGSAGLPSWEYAFCGNPGGYRFQAFTLPARASNILLSNFAINGNRNGNSTTGDPRGLPMTSCPPSAANNQWYVGIHIFNMSNVVLDRLLIQNTSSFCTRLSNVDTVLVTGCKFQSVITPTGGPPTSSIANNGDGLHINGNASDIRVDNCYFETGDDAIALNSCEGYPGPISLVTITNCTFHNSQTFMRAYFTGQLAGTPAQTGLIANVTMSNCTGQANEVGFLLGLEAAYTRYNLNRLQDFTISSSTLSAPTLVFITDNVGVLTLDNVRWVGTGVYGVIGSMVVFGFNGCTAANINIRNCVVYRTDLGDAASAGIIDFTAPTVFNSPGTGTHTIEHLVIDGLSVQDDSGTAYAPMPFVIRLNAGSQILRLDIESIDTRKFAQLLSNPAMFSQILSVRGAGVLATGWQFPDAVMDNGVPYISATDNLPSIKIGGAVKKYAIA